MLKFIGGILIRGQQDPGVSGSVNFDQHKSGKYFNPYQFQQ
jgi:hypothetical protein